jgi:hypothetical protein
MGGAIADSGVSLGAVIVFVELILGGGVSLGKGVMVSVGGCGVSDACGESVFVGGAGVLVGF